MKEMSDFLSKFKPPEKEEKPKELSTEEMIQKAVDSAVEKVLSVTQENKEKAELVKNLSEATGLKPSGLMQLSVEQLKAFQVDIKITDSPRASAFVDEKGNRKTLNELSEKEQAVISAQVLRKRLGLPQKTANEVERYLSIEREAPEGWYPKPAGREVG